MHESVVRVVHVRHNDGDLCAAIIASQDVVDCLCEPETVSVDDEMDGCNVVLKLVSPETLLPMDDPRYGTIPEGAIDYSILTADGKLQDPAKLIWQEAIKLVSDFNDDGSGETDAVSSDPPPPSRKSLIGQLHHRLQRHLYRENDPESNLTWKRSDYNGHLQALSLMCSKIAAATVSAQMFGDVESTAPQQTPADAWQLSCSISTARLTRFLTELRYLNQFEEYGKQAIEPEQAPVLPPAVLYPEMDRVDGNPLTWSELFAVGWSGLEAHGNLHAEIVAEKSDNSNLLRLTIRDRIDEDDHEGGDDEKQASHTVVSQAAVDQLQEQLREGLKDIPNVVDSVVLGQDGEIVISILTDAERSGSMLAASA
ncbi:hypothetical protein [Rhodopirellula bahusiensis]|uniref:hypothetical protein n=2 Tax=Rhodopirellula bahusiensis TaxID=2014065 RepID=UPI0032977E4E